MPWGQCRARSVSGTCPDQVPGTRHRRYEPRPPPSRSASSAMGRIPPSAAAPPANPNQPRFAQGCVVFCAKCDTRGAMPGSPFRAAADFGQNGPAEWATGASAQPAQPLASSRPDDPIADSGPANIIGACPPTDHAIEPSPQVVVASDLWKWGSLSRFGGNATGVTMVCSTTFQTFRGGWASERDSPTCRHRTTFRRFGGRRPGRDIVACPCRLSPPSNRKGRTRTLGRTTAGCSGRAEGRRALLPQSKGLAASLLPCGPAPGRDDYQDREGNQRPPGDAQCVVLPPEDVPHVVNPNPARNACWR
jgi:hypothetical protein